MRKKDKKDVDYTMYAKLYASKDLNANEKLLLGLLIAYTKYKGEVYDTSDKSFGERLGVSESTIERCRIKLKDLGYITTNKVVVKGKNKPLHIQVNKEKVNNDFGWHIFTDIKQSNVKENTNCNVSDLESRKNVCKFTETYSNAEQRRIRDELAKKRRDAKAEIN